MKLKRTFNILILSICIFIGSFAQASEQPKLEKFTVLLDWFANPDHAPIYVAKQQGYFAKEGLDVKIIEPADPNDPPKLVAAKQADIAITYQPQYVLQKKQNLPLVQVGTLIATPLNCLAVLQSSNIHSLKDLKGKTIGHSSSSGSHIMLKTMLASAGLTLNDVHLINVHYDLTQALLAGKVDAVTGMMRNYELIQLEQAGHPARAFYPEEHGMPAYSELIFITNKDEQKDPKIQKFLKAISLATQYLTDHPESSWKTFASNHPQLNNDLNRAVWQQTIPRFALRPDLVSPQRIIDYEKLLNS